MKTKLPISVQHLLMFIFLFFSGTSLFAQYCDPTVPSLTVDLSSSPNMNWTSPPITRDGHCCGTSNPDRCLEFVITLHPSAIAVSFDIASGAVPPGALFYQIDCGPVTPVGAPICLTGPGPHHLTFCKPGNNTNTFSIVSYSSPIIGPDITLNAGCQGFIYGNYYNESSVTWTSIGPGTPGAYDHLLSCNSGCDTTFVTAPIAGPAFVDYLVCGMDVGGCNPLPICDTVRVNFIDPVLVNITSLDVSLCAGATTTITANASGGTSPYAYLWSTGATSSSIVVGPGTYSVEVLDLSTCHTATNTITINQFSVPVVVAGVDQTVCQGTSVTLSGAGANTYAWDNGVTNGVSFVPAVGTVTYTVTGTDANGCVNTDQVNVTVNPLPIVSAGTDQTVCFGTAVTLSGSGANVYAWDNGVVNGVSFVPAVGTVTYTVTGTDANGCVNTDQVNVTVNPLPVVSAGADQTVCEGTAVTLSGAGASAYAWNNGVVNGVSFVPAVGTVTYTVTGTDANGCVNTDQVNVTVNPLPVVSAGADQTVCQGTAVTLTGSGANVYVWDNGVTNGVSFVPAVGTVTYTVTGTDANGCVNTDQVNVTVNPLPVVSAGADQTVCQGTAVTLNGAGSNVYAWDNGVVNGVSFVPAVGTITYTVTGTDANGCVNTDQVNVTVNPLPVVFAGADQTVCQGTAVTLSGAGANTYTWDNGVVNGVSFVQAVGTVTYTITGTDANGCVNTDQVNVTVNPLPIVFAGADQTVCEGTAVTLSGSGANVYVWDNGVVNGVSFVPAVGTITYTVTGTDVNGCVNQDAVQVTVHPLPVINGGADQAVCEGTPVTLYAEGTSNLSWDNGVINNVAFIQPVGVMTYIVYDSLSTGCASRDTVNVRVYPAPIVTSTDAEICEGEGVTLSAQGAVSYSWSGGISNGIEFFPSTSNTYVVQGTSAQGCTAESSSTVIVHPAPIAKFKINNLNLTTTNPTTGFTNLSTGATSYTWDFGDGSPTSSEFEPVHTFPSDESSEYQITLTATSDFGCQAEAIKYVHVFLDYTIYVPNTFTPDNNGENEIFLPIMTGFDEQHYTLYIFNRWGDLVFESHDILVGWDGTFARQDYQVQDGAYTWKIIAQIKESSDTKIFVGHVLILK